MFYLHGMDRERLLAHARSFASEVVRPWVYPELRQIVEGHRQAGRILVLNTASPDFYAREIARELGFDHCVATQVEVPESFPLMVKVIGENNKREAKIAAMKQKVPAVATAGEASLSDSWSYSDSSADLPLLEFAGHGVLVHPSASLEALGRERGWEVIHPARPYSGRAGDMFCALRQFFGLYGVAPPSQGGCGFALSRATEEA
jgi:HAD superfamily hydrolase (TIGR01490 family)